MLFPRFTLYHDRNVIGKQTWRVDKAPRENLPRVICSRSFFFFHASRNISIWQNFLECRSCFQCLPPPKEIESEAAYHSQLKKTTNGTKEHSFLNAWLGPFSDLIDRKVSSVRGKEKISKIQESWIWHHRLILKILLSDQHMIPFYVTLGLVSYRQPRRRQCWPSIFKKCPSNSFCYRAEKVETQFGRSTAHFFQLGSQTANHVCSSFRLHFALLFLQFELGRNI